MKIATYAEFTSAQRELVKLAKDMYEEWKHTPAGKRYAELDEATKTFLEDEQAKLLDNVRTLGNGPGTAKAKATLLEDVVSKLGIPKIPGNN